MARLPTLWDPFHARDPFPELGDLRSRFDRLFEWGDEGRGRRPRLDVIREDDQIVMRADLPGVKPEDVKIEFEDDVLTISGEHEEEREENGKRFLRHERRYGSFSRSITLPEGVTAEDIDATCKHGVLEVRVPVQERPRAKAVKITPRSGEGN